MQRTLRLAPHFARRGRPLSFIAPTLSASSLETLVLPNGVAVASQPFSGPVVSMGAIVEVGSRHETDTTSGLCNLIAQAKVLELAAAVEKVGGSLTASVSRDATYYTATVLKASAGEAAAVLAKCVSGVAPSPAAFTAAAETVVADMKASDHGAKVLEDVHGCAFLDTPMGRPVAGTAATLGALGAADAVAFCASAAYAGAAVKGVGVGAGTELAAALGGLPATKAAGAPAVAVAPATFTGSDKRTSFESYPHATIAVAYEFPTLDSDYAPAAALLPEILGSLAPAPPSAIDPINAHAKLTQTLAEQGCALSAEPFYAPYKDTALMGLKVTAADINVEDACWYFMNNLVRLSFDVKDVEVSRAKLAYKANMAAAAASPTALVAIIAHPFVTTGYALSPAELTAKIDAVTVDDVKKVAYKFLHDNDHALAAAGPLHELPDYNYIRTASYNYHY